jgi:hypothetical protein
MDKNYYRCHPVVHVDVEDSLKLFHDSNELIDDDSNVNIDLHHIPDFHTLIFKNMIFLSYKMNLPGIIKNMIIIFNWCTF